MITGGTTGIGAATRKLLLSQGHEVFNIDFKGGTALRICPLRKDARALLTRYSAAIPTALTY